MSCDPHPNVLEPCANDAVGSLEALGTSGDVAFDERGYLALTAGQTEVVVAFTYEKTSADYVFEYLYVKCSDATPDAIIPVVQVQATKSFTLKFSGSPTTANSVLYWRVRIPDNLQECQSNAMGVHYAIVPHAQEGITPLVVDQDFIEVLFPDEHPTADWRGTFNIGFAGIDPPIGDPQVFSCTITSQGVTGFRLDFQGAPEVSGYVLRWRVS